MTYHDCTDHDARSAPIHRWLDGVLTGFRSPQSNPRGGRDRSRPRSHTRRGDRAGRGDGAMTFWQFADAHPVALVLALLVIGLAVESVATVIVNARRR